MRIMRSKIAFFSIVYLFLFFAAVGIAHACGPFFNDYLYMPDDSDTYHPLQENNVLFDPNYGLILSNWGPEYLYPVYMNLIGKKVSEETKKALLQYYGYGKFFVDNLVSETGKWIEIEEWKKVRKTVVSEDIKIANYTEYGNGYSFYINCNPSAFITAKETLEQRKKIYSRQQLISWVKQQDEVFSNCNMPLTKKIILSEHANILSVISEALLNIRNMLPNNWIIRRAVKTPTADELFRYDKEYQDAARDFYQANFDAAEKAFRKIADNYNHPWRGYASLVIGRIYIRRAELGTVEKYDDSKKPEDIKKAQEVRNKLYAKAEKQFNKILADSSLSAVHSGAKDLRNFVLFRIDPKKRLKIANEVLQTSTNSDEIINNIEDYSLLWNDKVRNKDNEDERKDWEKYILREGGDFTQWVYIWKYGGQDSLKFALDKYHKEKSLPWLLASVKYMTPDNLSRDEIILAVGNIPQDSSAYLTANYYRIKLLIASGLKKEAKKDLENIFTMIKRDNNLLAENYFNDIRMLLADSLNEALSYSLRNVIYVENDFSLEATSYVYKKPGKPMRLLDKNVARAFNKFIPMNKWVDIILDDTSLTPEIRKQMGLIAFIRAVLLEDWKTAQTIADFVASDLSLKKDLVSFRTAVSDEEKKFTSALFLLDYAGIGNSFDYRSEDILAGDFPMKGLDDYRRNWWCDEKAMTESTSSKSSLFLNTWFDFDDKLGHEETLKKFLSQKDLTLAVDENSKIYANVAPNYLSSVVINYAVNHPNDQRVPKALHLVVTTATRIPLCLSKETTEFSRRAFQMLHNNYPNNYWTKETPHWY